MEASPRNSDLLPLLRLAAQARTRPELEKVLERILRGARETAAETVILKVVGPGDEGLEVRIPRRAAAVPEPFVGGLLVRARRQRGRHVLAVSPARIPTPFRECRALSVSPHDGPSGVLCVLSRRKAAFGRVTMERLAAITEAATLALETFLQREGLQRRLLVAERERVARELHDGPLQYLVNALQHLRLAPSTEGRVALRGARKNLQEGIHGLREIIRIQRQGSAGTRRLNLRDLLTWFTETANTPLDVEWDLQEDLLPPDLRVELFYIIREALVNISHHARADHVRIRGTLSRGALHVEVRDDGVGFDGAAARRRAKGYGLLTLQERASSLGGRATIRSQPGAGTIVRVHIPLSREGKSQRSGV